MASIANDPNGLKRILFINQDGKRKVIRLGKVDKRQATTIKLHVEALAQRKRSPSLGLSDATASWLVDLDDDLRDKLAAVGLIDPPKRATLGPFVTDYIAKRVPLVEAGKLKPDTLRIERVTRDCRIDFLGADKRLRDISEGDAEDFRDWMLSKGGRPLKRCGPETVVRGRTPLSEATTRKRCSIASKFFRYAVRHGLVGHNPFEAVPKSNISTKRRAYIDAADAQGVLGELPSTEWRLLFALSRWGGLRVGSEVRLLTWADVDWERQRLLVHSPKTERHVGHESREVPIFPELSPLLDARYEEATEGERYILPMLQGRTDAALRSTLLRAIKRAGLVA